jgi:hypothetical protein
MKRNGKCRAVEDAHPAAFYSKSLCESQELFSVRRKEAFFYAK